MERPLVGSASDRAGGPAAGARGRRCVVIAEDPEVRDGWARALEAAGLEVARCAGPGISCILVRGAQSCPLLDDAAFALYDERLLTPAFAALLAASRSEAMRIAARDRTRMDGDHEPALSHVLAGRVS